MNGHVFKESMAGVGIAMESMLQNLKLPYVVDYDMGEFQSSYVYSPKDQHMIQLKVKGKLLDVKNLLHLKSL